MTTIGIVIEVAPKKALIRSAYRRLMAPRLILPPAYEWHSWAAFVPLVSSGKAQRPRPEGRERPRVRVSSARAPALAAAPLTEANDSVAFKLTQNLVEIGAAPDVRPPSRLAAVMRAFLSRSVSWLNYPLVDYSLKVSGAREQQGLEATDSPASGESPASLAA